MMMIINKMMMMMIKQYNDQILDTKDNDSREVEKRQSMQSNCPNDFLTQVHVSWECGLGVACTNPWVQFLHL